MDSQSLRHFEVKLHIKQLHSRGISLFEEKPKSKSGSIIDCREHLVEVGVVVEADQLHFFVTQQDLH